MTDFIDKGSSFMDGKKSWTGLLLVVIPFILDFLDVPYTDEDVLRVLEGFGILLASYGVWRKQQKLTKAISQ